jgi:predicted aconitase
MSLISQTDRQMVIEKYAAEAETSEYYLGTPHHSSSEIHALLNWINLEYYKNDNQSVV